MPKFDIAGELRYSWPMSLNVSLTSHLEAFIHQTVTSGRYQSASEVVRAALRLLEEREQQRQTALEAVRKMAQDGLDSGPAMPLPDDYWDQLREDLKRRSESGNNG
jgi:antitoxin ParD1/3/4